MNVVMASVSSRTEAKVPRRMAWRVMIPKKISTLFSQEEAGRFPGYIAGVWAGAAALLAVVPAASYALLRDASDTTLAAATGISPGASLSALVETTLPEAAHGSPSGSPSSPARDHLPSSPLPASVPERIRSRLAPRLRPAGQARPEGPRRCRKA
jgi:zinc transporter ZupT